MEHHRMALHVKAAADYPDELTDLEAADYLGTFVSQIASWQAAGAFGHWIETPTGRQWRVRRADLDAWLDQQAASLGLPPRPTSAD